jgi:hypothetical protein
MLRPVTRHWRHGLATVALAAASVGIAQKVISAKAGLVYFVQGRAAVEGNGRLPTGAKTRQLKNGDTLMTDRGRVEVLLNPGTVLRLGEAGRIRMDETLLVDTRLTIQSGSVVVTSFMPPKEDRVEIRIFGAVVVLKGDGIYRFDLAPPRLRIYSGQVTVRPSKPLVAESTSTETTVKSGFAVALGDLQIAKFEPKEKDDFETWAESRSRRPMPPGLRAMPPRIAWADQSSRSQSKSPPPPSPDSQNPNP